MKSDEQVWLITGSVARWNEWRIKNPRARADLHGTDFSLRNLAGANLKNAHLHDCTFAATILDDADFSGACLIGARFERTRLVRTTLTNAEMGRNTFFGVDLTCAIGLETTRHSDTSKLDLKTLRLAHGRLPQRFLEGCGLTASEVAFHRLYDERLTADEITSLVYAIDASVAAQPIQISPVFISYSHSDGDFVDALEDELYARRIRFWRDIHHSTSGRLDAQVDRAIRLNPTVLLVLSHYSTMSDWVQWEVERARELERESQRDVLCPVALDDSWKTCSWPGPLRQQVKKYNIVDFSRWRDRGILRAQFERLAKGLRLYYSRSSGVS